MTVIQRGWMGMDFHLSEISNESTESEQGHGSVISREKRLPKAGL